MSSKQWLLKDWNAALVEAVFLAQGRAESTVSRIDASGRFLAKCTKSKESKPEEALQLFINAFGKTASSVRAKFRTSSATEVDGIPKCFAAIYLTLLAASADNETAGVGDFRKRFSKIVKATGGQLVDFSNLPSMWLDIKNWTELRSNLVGDCALLVLPDPKNEKLIGYSKRIAFPAYRDEIFLRKTLQKYNLVENSSFADVASAVAREIGQANTLQNFLEEFIEFTKLVARSEYQEAYESPFWGAVRDICLEYAQVLAVKKGIASLEIDVADPTEPQLYFYMDDLSKNRLKLPARELNFARRDGCKYIAFSEGKYPSANNLQDLASNSKSFADSKIGKGLSEGWLIFLPNHLGELTSEGTFYVGGPVCLIAKNSELSPLITLSEHLGIKSIKLSHEGGLTGWLGLFIPSVSEQYLKRLLSYVPNSVQSFLRTGWAPLRPRISGGAWYGQMMLLNPASNPTVRMRGAIKGIYRLLGINSEEIKRGDLIKLDDDFQIPARNLIDVELSARACEFILSLPNEKTVATKILLTAEQPAGDVFKFKDRSQWLADGPTGLLCRLDAGHKVDAKSSYPLNNFLPKDQFPPLLKIDPNFLGCECINNDIYGLPSAFNWLANALTLRFDKRSSLTFDLLNEHVSGAAEAAGYKSRSLKLLLFYGQWLVNQIQRSAPHNSVSRSGIEMVVTSRHGELIARVVGMISRQTASRLMKSLQSDESCRRIEAKNVLSIGCLEINVSSEERAIQLAQEIGAQVVKSYLYPTPLAALSPMASEMHLTESPMTIHQVEKWNWGWSPTDEAHAQWPVGELRRNVNGARTWYLIKLADKMFVKTDSVSWAWMASSISRGEVVARQSEKGNIIWNKSLVELPASLTRWWMLFGGGCIAITEDGNTIFTGYDCSQAIEFMGWKSAGVQYVQGSIAVERRKLALRLKNSRRILVTKS